MPTSMRSRSVSREAWGTSWIDLGSEGRHHIPVECVGLRERMGGERRNKDVVHRKYKRCIMLDGFHFISLRKIN
jgi:hypothetical protein